MADELADRAAIATLLLDTSIALDDLARRLSTAKIGKHEASAALVVLAERLATGSEVAMDRLLA